MTDKLQKTNIAGLDFLLNNGFRIPAGRSLNILVRGNAGTGKTTLSLQMGINVAKQGDIGFYYALEQSLTDLEQAVYGFNWIKGGSPVIAVGGEDKSEQIANKGGLLISSISKENISLLTEVISKDISDIEKLSDRRVRFIAIDSINAIGQGKILRDSFKELINKFSSQDGCVVITTFEEQGTQEFRSAIEDFLVDVVIRLGYRYRTDRKDFLERFVEVVKCRSQFHQRGRHPFSIINPKDYAERIREKEGQIEGGIYIYPSVAATLSSLVKKEFKKNGKRLSTGLDGLDELLPKSERKGGIWEGACSLLIGERGTKKTVMGLHFLAEGVKEKEKCLLISLRDDEDAIKTVAKEYRFLRENLFPDQKCSPFLKVKHRRSCYITSEAFIYYVKKWVGEERNAGGENQIKRVLFDNLGQIKLRFPLLEANPMFVPALIDLFKTEGITSLFIDLENPERAILEYTSPILDLADYVIATEHLPFLGRDHTVITVRRSRQGRHNAEPAEVRREGDRIVIDSLAFEGITGVLTKNPEPAEIFVKLFYENEVEKAFNDEMKKEFTEKYGRKVHVSSFSRGDLAREYGRIKRYWIEAPRSIVKVVSLDEYWVKYAAHEGILWEIDKKWFAKEQGEDWLRKERNDFLSGSLRPTEVNDNLYAIPNYLDLGLFCYRKDLFKDVFGDGEVPPNNIDELIDLVQGKPKDIKERGLWGFGFDMETEESVVCTFLEFLCNTSTPNGKAGEKFHSISNDEQKHELLMLSDDDVRKAAIQALETMKSLVEGGIMPYPCTLEHCKDTIFSRQWYSTLQCVYYDWWHWLDEEGKLRRKKKYEKAEFTIMKFPVVNSKEGNGDKGVDHYACSGSWYLGILKESLRPRLGYHLIDEMTSMPKIFRRHELGGAGLPARKSFYRFHGDKTVKNVGGLRYKEVMDSFEGQKECDRKLCRRESICGNDVELYRAILTNIADMVLNVLEGKDPEKAINEMANVIRQVAGDRLLNC